MILKNIQNDIEKLCVSIPHRHVGSKGNQQAVDYAYDRLSKLGFETKKQRFDCIDWEAGNQKMELKIGAGTKSIIKKLKAFVSPYSQSCNLHNTDFLPISSIKQLKNAYLKNKIAVLHGDIAKEQIMPKNFVFYNPDHHKEIIALLEEKQPAAIIAITDNDPSLAGGWSPFPLFEDGDFDIPSVYMEVEDGKEILRNPSAKLSLKFWSKRIPSKGYNIIANQKGRSKKKIIFLAHIDTKQNTPGALDNATGVTVMLNLAKLLANYSGVYTIEIFIPNGEDYYSAPGQMLYLREFKDSFDDILLAVNIDANGCKGVRDSYCTFGVDEKTKQIIDNVFSDDTRFVESAPWYQGDHAIFVQNGVPALAITSENFTMLSSKITHTEKDTLDLVDCSKIEDLGKALKKFVKRLNYNTSKH